MIPTSSPRALLLGVALGAGCVEPMEGRFDATNGDRATIDARPRSDAEDAPTTQLDASEDARDATSNDSPTQDSPSRVCPPRGATRDCSRGTGTGEGDQCRDGPSCYVALVQRAVQDTINGNPSWFDSSGGCPRILDVPRFMDAVVASLVAQGVCAIRDPNAPNEEVTVKVDNAFSENFDIVASTGCARYGTAIYTGYCAPAWW